MPETGQNQERFCPLGSAQSLAESDKLIGWPISICAKGRELLRGFATGRLGILAPGMVRGRGLGDPDLMIQAFSVGHFSLKNGLVVDGVEQGLALVEDSDIPLGIEREGDLGVAQGVVRAVGLDLVDDLVELHGQVLGKGPSFLMGQNEIQVFGLE